MRIHYLILASLFFSCATRIKLPVYKPTISKIQPGKVKKLSIKKPEVGRDFKIKCLDKELAVTQEGNYLSSFLSLHYKFMEKNEARLINCYLESLVGQKKISYHIYQFSVEEFPYKTTRLRVPKKYTKLSDSDLARWKGEQEVLKSVYANTIKSKKLFDKPFVRPLQSKITSLYGNRRTFNNTTQSYHSGTDFRARKPTPIPVSNDGVVVYAGFLLFNGGTVIVDHGMGILTMYCHFSQVYSKVGDIVKQGDVVGLSGNTGRSNAPHLHWGVKVQGAWIDGLQFLDEQFNELVSNYESGPTK